ncbi:MAG: threonine/serine exporter family protein [Phycisphaera sp.]|nr:MAG: threonine/serine exporter family protein [Phycisphaera sp.]
MVNLHQAIPTEQQGLPNDDASTFIIKMTKALATYGAPAHRLEDALNTVSDRLGIEGQFFSAPTAVFASINAPGDKPHTYLIRVHPGEVHLERMVQLDEILVEVGEGRLSPAEGNQRIESALAEPDRYGVLLTIASFSVSSACAARFFGGGLNEVFAALFAGLAIGLLIVLASRGRDLARLIEFMCGLMVSFGAIAWARLVQPISPEILMLAGLIVLFPGLTLTMAINELATRNLSSGTSRMMSAISALVSIGFGVALGTRFADMLFGAAAAPYEPGALPGWTLYLAVGIAPIALTVLFKARPLDTPALILSGLIGYAGARIGALNFGPELGACVGAGLMGLYANLYSRVARRPSTVPSTVGVMLLVPGSISFQSVSSFLAHDAVGGIDTAFTTLLVAMSLVIGFLLSNVALPPRRAL